MRRRMSVNGPPAAGGRRPSIGGQDLFEVRRGSKKLQLSVGGMGLQLLTSKGKPVDSYMYGNMASWSVDDDDELTIVLDGGVEVVLEVGSEAAAQEILSQMTSFATALAKASRPDAPESDDDADGGGSTSGSELASDDRRSDDSASHDASDDWSEKGSSSSSSSEDGYDPTAQDAPPAQTLAAAAAAAAAGSAELPPPPKQQNVQNETAGRSALGALPANQRLPPPPPAVVDLPPPPPPAYDSDGDVEPPPPPPPPPLPPPPPPPAPTASKPGLGGRLRRRMSISEHATPAGGRRGSIGGQGMFDVKRGKKKLQLSVGGMGLQLMSGGKPVESYMYSKIVSWSDGESRATASFLALRCVATVEISALY